MGLFIEIKDAGIPATPTFADENNAMLIGRSTVMPETNPFLASSINALDSLLIPTSSTLYKSAQAYFNHSAGSGNGLWCYAVSGAQQLEYEVMLAGARDGSNTTFYVPYSPIVSVDKIETNFYGSGWAEIPYGSGWVTGTYDGSPDGRIVWADGVTYSGADGTGFFSGLYPNATDYLRCDVTFNPLGKAFNDLSDQSIYFQYFTFAYDQEKTQPVDGVKKKHNQ